MLRNIELSGTNTFSPPGGATLNAGAVCASTIESQQAICAIEFEKVSKSFGAHRVMVDLNLQVRRGEKLTLIGPSGSGKTTVLRLAMSLERPTSGDVKILGESMLFDAAGKTLSSSQEARIRRRCGMIFQQFNLFPHLTVLQNLILAPTTVLRQPKAKAAQSALEYLKMVGLEGKVDAYPAQQSRSRKSEQDDKWNFCLTTAMVAVNRRNHEQTTPPEPLTGLQGKGGSGRRQGRPDNRPVGGAFRRSPQSDHGLEIAA